MVQGHERPVGHDAANVLAAAAELAALVLADNEVLDGSGVEELDVGHLEARKGHSTVRIGTDVHDTYNMIQENMM